MFKLESYIAPILLSYVDKYIKNFKPEDSQVSLWGGDALFQNLDLRLEVLEHELKSPFTFISGHIRELMIHVPWTKLTSEPITITINTIECVLTLKDPGAPVPSEVSNLLNKDKKRATTNRQIVETPPNYIQLLINKIVSNIQIFCNNLILKYVEEDVVLSMNVRHLKLQSCNDKWQAAYTDLSPTQVVIRKLITVNDLTICLDKRNASGKIEVYQEPILYKCSLRMHFLRSYLASTVNKTSLTRLDIECMKMEFSISDQQVPMIYRIMVLLLALQQKKLKVSQEHQDAGSDSLHSEGKDGGDNSETWTNWAWSYVTSVLPTQWEEDSKEQFLNSSGHVIHIGFYIDVASVTFKVAELTDKSYPKKVRQYPILTVRIRGIFSEVIMIGLKWLHSSAGVFNIIVAPVGACTCSHPEFVDENEDEDFPSTANYYLQLGDNAEGSLKKDSLFDALALENNGKYRFYNSNWDHHFAANTEEVLLERSPAIAFDYIYNMIVPDDITSEMLSDASSNFEYSNYQERSMMRLCLSGLKLTFCSGLYHRVLTLIAAASVYDYPPYYVEKSDPSLNDLLPPSEEDFDALSEFIPTRTVRIMIYKPIIELNLMDHPYFEPTSNCLAKKTKKTIMSGSCPLPPMLPKITIECQILEISKVDPVYVNRLVHTTCQLPEQPKQMFDRCFSDIHLNVVGLCSRLLLKSTQQTTIIVPSNIHFQKKTIFKPQYWIKSNIPHDHMILTIDNLTINGTNPKLTLVSDIIRSILSGRDCRKTVVNTSLLFDACKDYDMPYLELYIENLKYEKLTTNCTVSINIECGAIKGFIFETLAQYTSAGSEIEQVLFLSGPDNHSSKSSKNPSPLFSLTLQYPLCLDKQQHPPLLILDSQEIRICMDPLLFKLLLYYPVYITNKHEIIESFGQLKNYSDTLGTISETSRKFSQHIESVHSSSDQNTKCIKRETTSKRSMPREENKVDFQVKIEAFLKEWVVVWKNMVISGRISQCTIYFPTKSISAVGSQGVEEAIKEAVENGDVNVLVVVLPNATIQSSQKQNLTKYVSSLPVKLPKEIWTLDKISFPWTLSISDLNVYTIQTEKIVCVKPVSLSATVGLSTKQDSKTPTTTTTDDLLSTMDNLGIYVHIDMTSVFISLNSTQIYLLTIICEGLSQAITKLIPIEHCPPIQKQEVLPPILNSPSVSQKVGENTNENSSEGTSQLAEDKTDEEQYSFKLTAWIQWTITRFNIQLIVDTPNNIDDNKVEMKLLIDVEDIVSSLDYQDIYLKLKGKIGSVQIQHFSRCNEDSWTPGQFSGYIMRLREDIPLENRNEDCGFICVTLTRASSQHTHHLWGATQKTKKEDKLITKIKRQFITEIVINIQPIDIILPPKILTNFIPILDSYKDRYELDVETAPTETGDPEWFNNRNLPLAYVDCQYIRIMIPSSNFKGNDHLSHNVMIIQVTKIALNPMVANPICRSPIRPDIYRHAAQARILNIPGSEMEDRQYQLDIIGLAICTANWEDLDSVLNTSERFSENPALEWNNLERGQLSIIPILNLKHIAERFDISIVAAPAMIYKNDILICGNSFEINVTSDLTLQLSFTQIELINTLFEECTPSYKISENSSIYKYETYLKFKKYCNFTTEIESELTDFYKDSGIDTSDIHSVLSAKCVIAEPKRSPTRYQIPSDTLITAGKISFALYDSATAVKHEQEYQQVEELGELSATEPEDISKKYIPVMLLQISQPNAYFCKQQFFKKWQISVFDFAIKIELEKNITPIDTIPTIQNFSVNILETRSGNPNPTTGIPPAFLTIKLIKDIGKLYNISIQMGRPIKLIISREKLLHLLNLQSKINRYFPNKRKQSIYMEKRNKSTFRTLKEQFQNIDCINFATEQLIFTMETKSDIDCIVGVNKVRSKLYFVERPEKICNSIKINGATLGFKTQDDYLAIMNPFNFTMDNSSFLDPWQDINSDAHVNFSLRGKCWLLYICPDRIKSIGIVTEDLVESLALVTETSGITVPQEGVSFNSLKHIEREQHYKDDLRAGAFQFININSNNIDELPLPYQVIFWTNPRISAMAWRYPHPRTLTKIRVFPVPFDVVQNVDTKKIDCSLQYWSDYQHCYVNFVNFDLSENEINYLNLPKIEPQRAVASVWRVVLRVHDDFSTQPILISPRALAACMRIDSYFNPNLVPKITAIATINKLEIAFCTNFNGKQDNLPSCLNSFTSDNLIPETHTFLTSVWDNIRLSLEQWNAQIYSVEMNALNTANIIDYLFLNQKILIPQFLMKINLDVANELRCSLITTDIHLIFGPTTAHTITVNTNCWLQTLNKDIKPQFVIFSRYLICNDTNVNIRFGQKLTDEDILLTSKNFHLYSWRSLTQPRKIQVALEDGEWTKSKSFYIDFDGVYTIPMYNGNSFALIVTIESLSATQKQITISGQLIIANMLLEHFELKIVPIVKTEQEIELRKSPSFILKGKSFTSSILIDYKKEYFMRLRFFGLDSAWTGDIPLKQHMKATQPWLVKVPLQERGQFLSIWCRISIQEMPKTRKILAVLWPLFTVKSSLPVATKIHIFTPRLNLHLDSVMNGKGQLQQLYCPGTIDHSHQLTFKLDDGTPISQTYVPLNYSLVDQELFFKKQGKEDVADILKTLRSYDETKWPNLGEDWDNIDWIVEEQPQTSVQVHYRNACPYSSALLVEILPWCLIANTFGCRVSILANGTELCRIPQYGIVAPPRLEENFHLGIEADFIWCYSGSLQLAKSDWSQAFYMPIISGTLPIEGQITTSLKSNSFVHMVSLSSSMVDEIRLLMISSTHVFTNRLNREVCVACFAVPESSNTINYDIPQNLKEISFKVEPHSKKSVGIPILRWLCVDETVDTADYCFYMSFSLSSEWSCPIQVDQCLRKSFAVNLNNQSIPLVLTSHKHKGQIYLSLFHDDRPQVYIENQTNINLYCGQLNNNEGIIPECKHFKWHNTIKQHQNSYYTMPFVSEKFPELPQVCFAEKISFVVANQNVEEWSASTSITSDSEQYIKLPHYGDVKLMVKVTAFATLLKIGPADQVEVNASEIRGRLSKHERGESEVTNKDDVPMKSQRTTSLPLSSCDSLESSYRKLFKPTFPIKEPWSSLKICSFIKSFGIILITDQDIDQNIQEVAAILFDCIQLQISQGSMCDVQLFVSDIQFDNQRYLKESYDFPVILVGREPNQLPVDLQLMTTTCEELIEKFSKNSLLTTKLIIETFHEKDSKDSVSGVRDAVISVQPLSCYFEDTFITHLTEYLKTLLPAKIAIQHYNKKTHDLTGVVKIPDAIYWEASMIAKPLSLRNITVESISLLLSVHCSVKMYIALDQSPLDFGPLERRRLMTTHYRLGHAMTMHYLSGAIFGAGWVVSSLELLGSPSGLARAMGTGLRDFINLPYRGLFQGPTAFVIAITQGSASLMKHVTAGTLQSVTKLASSVARNLDRLSLDEEHLKRTEEQRRVKPKGVAEGFKQGLTGLGISLLGAVGGIAHHPLQSLMSDNASPRSIAAALGLGLVGVITKPLSGAAELVALTGQGLLQGAGWNPLPQPRMVNWHSATPLGPYNLIKYKWKLLALLSKEVLTAIEATNCDYNPNVLIFTKDALVIIDTDTDVVSRILSLSQLQVTKDPADPTLLSFKILPEVMTPKIEDEIEMDPVWRARVADYIRNSTSSLLQSTELSICSEDTISTFDEKSEIISFYVNPTIRTYIITLIIMAKQQSQNNCSFPTL